MSYFYKKNENYEAGFCSTLNNTINICSQYHNYFGDFNLEIDVHELNQFFSFKKIQENSQDFEPLWLNSNFDNSSNAHTICDIDKVKRKKFIFDNFFQFKNIELFKENSTKYITEKTLGLQIRGTDKFREITPPTLDKVFRMIDNKIENYKLDSIFLSTDDIKYQNALIKEFGDLVIYTEKTISKDGKPIHFISDRSVIFQEVMLDVYLLSQCKYFLYCFSNVSYSSLILGIDNFINIECIN